MVGDAAEVEQRLFVAKERRNTKRSRARSRPCACETVREERPVSEGVVTLRATVRATKARVLPAPTSVPLKRPTEGTAATGRGRDVDELVGLLIGAEQGALWIDGQTRHSVEAECPNGARRPALTIDRNELTAGDIDPVEVTVRGESKIFHAVETERPNGTPRSALAINPDELTASEVDAVEMTVRGGRQSGYAREAEWPNCTPRPAFAIDHDELAALGIGAEKSTVGREGESPHIPCVERTDHTPSAACGIDDDELTAAGVDAEERAAGIKSEASDVLEAERSDGAVECVLAAGDAK